MKGRAGYLIARFWRRASMAARWGAAGPLMIRVPEWPQPGQLGWAGVNQAPHARQADPEGNPPGE